MNRHALKYSTDRPPPPLPCPLAPLIDEGLRGLPARRAGPTTLPAGGSGGLQPGVGIDGFAAPVRPARPEVVA